MNANRLADKKRDKTFRGFDLLLGDTGDERTMSKTQLEVTE